MRIALGIFLILHGVAHLPGFVVPWRLANIKDVPYKTTLLSGRFDIGDAGIGLLRYRHWRLISRPVRCRRTALDRTAIPPGPMSP